MTDSAVALSCTELCSYSQYIVYASIVLVESHRFHQPHL